MTKPQKRDWPNPGSQLSLQHFLIILHEYLVSLSERQYVLKVLYASLFEEDLTIQPFECREATDALEEMCTLVQECNNLLSGDASILPIAALAPRYRFLFATQVVLDQTRRLIDLFDSYCVMCLEPSPQAEWMRNKIQEMFQGVLKYISDIPRQTLYLEEQSKSLEQDLVAAMRETYT